MGQPYDYRKDYYHILKVAKSASSGDIRRAYYSLAKQLHPDKNAGDQAKAETFKGVSEAYEVLSDQFVRQSYDDARKIFDHRYTTPEDDYEDDGTSKEQAKPKRKATRRAEKKKNKTKTKTAEKSNDQSEVPPEFRERARSTYAYTYPSPQSSAGQSGSPNSSSESHVESEPEELFDDREPCKNFIFSNYFHKDCTERPFLSELRRAKYQALRAWRLAKNQTADAKFALDFPDDGEDLDVLIGAWEDKKKAVQTLWQAKSDAEVRCHEHERRARIVMQEKREKGK